MWVVRGRRYVDGGMHVDGGDSMSATCRRQRGARLSAWRKILVQFWVAFHVAFRIHHISSAFRRLFAGISY